MQVFCRFRYQKHSPPQAEKPRGTECERTESVRKLWTVALNIAKFSKMYTLWELLCNWHVQSLIKVCRGTQQTGLTGHSGEAAIKIHQVNGKSQLAYHKSNHDFNKLCWEGKKLHLIEVQLNSVVTSWKWLDICVVTNKCRYNRVVKCYVNSDEFIGTREYLTLQATCRINRCHYKRVQLYLCTAALKKLNSTKMKRMDITVTYLRDNLKKSVLFFQHAY
jgi:hypothetical protein